jgi:SAM-dependent methyltransferase
MTRPQPAGDVDYERHGAGYAQLRRTDPRIAAFVYRALGDARTVLNVGAGAGSYEPDDRYVTAVEPSAAMRAQRPPERVPAIDAVAEHLPFDDDTFDAATAFVTVHQWTDLDAGLREMRRVSRDRVVVLTAHGPALDDFWLREYLPEVIELEQRRYPPIDRIVSVLTAGGGTGEVISVPIPHDCTDGFGEAYYGRPEDFLRPEVRAAQSAWVLTDQAVVARGVAALVADLADGTWDARYGGLRTLPQWHGSIRLIVARR